MSQVTTSLEEVIKLAAIDTQLFESHFFPQTSRVPPAKFHPEMNELLDGPARFCNIEVFRGGAKTSKFRMYAMKRICYGISRTIVVVGKNEAHALRTTIWIKNQVEKNKQIQAAFKLKKGAKWQDGEFQIVNPVAETTTWVVALGITGSVRGVNLDDYRPDLILVDDVLDEDNSLSPEARQKTEKLVLGALKYSLISRMEAPFAKMVILQTPMDAEDISQQAKKDPLWTSVRFGCWTRETEDLPMSQRESSWPELFPTEDLRAEREAAIAKNRLSIFSREMECKLVTPETNAFREEWLQFYGPEEKEPTPEWHEMWIEVVIDPVPPPSDAQIKRNLHNKDYEAIVVVGKKQGKYYLLEEVYNRGHDPSWTIAEFFRVCDKWRPKKILVESVAYQRTLAWLLRKAMQTAGRYWLVEEFTDKRSKFNKIVDGIKGVASNKQLYVSRNNNPEFISQYVGYSNIPHDDVLEGVAIGLLSLEKPVMAGDEDRDMKTAEAEIESLGDYRGAP